MLESRRSTDIHELALLVPREASYAERYEKIRSRFVEPESGFLKAPGDSPIFPTRSQLVAAVAECVIGTRFPKEAYDRMRNSPFAHPLQDGSLWHRRIIRTNAGILKPPRDSTVDQRAELWGNVLEAMTGAPVHVRSPERGPPLEALLLEHLIDVERGVSSAEDVLHALRKQFHDEKGWLDRRRIMMQDYSAATQLLATYIVARGDRARGLDEYTALRDSRYYDDERRAWRSFDEDAEQPDPAPEVAALLELMIEATLEPPSADTRGAAAGAIPEILTL